MKLQGKLAGLLEIQNLTTSFITYLTKVFLKLEESIS